MTRAKDTAAPDATGNRAHGSGAAAEPVERGRYAAFPQPDGSNGLMIYRATKLCDRCRDCGCGDQQDPIDLSLKGLMAMRSVIARAGKGFLPL